MKRSESWVRRQGMSCLRMCRGSKGLSLIELLAVLTIMSILVMMAAPMAGVFYYHEKELLLREHLRQIRNAIDKYYAENDGKYPTSLFELIDLNYIRKPYLINPVTNTMYEWNLVMSRPSSLDTGNDNRIYPEDFIIRYPAWTRYFDSDGFWKDNDDLGNSLTPSGIFDIQFPGHRLSLDEKTYYDEW